MKPDCAFEPDAAEIRCVECEKLTGLTGTCEDVGFCADCKEDFIQGAMHEGGTRAQAEAAFSATLVSLIEGAPFKTKFIPRRVLHVAVDGKPLCGAKGGPHPLTNNQNESNCKRCLKRLAAQKAIQS